MRRVSESLAGRASYLVLSLMTSREQQGRGRGDIWSDLLDTDTPDTPTPLHLRHRRTHQLAKPLDTTPPTR